MILGPYPFSRFVNFLSDHLDEVLTVLFLLMLVGLGVWRGSPIFENIRASSLAWRTVQLLCLALLISFVLTRGKVRALLRDWLPFVLALMVYEGLKHMHATAITTALGISPIDPILISIDRFLFGEMAHEVAQRLINGNHHVLFVLKIFYAGYYFLPGIVMGYLYLSTDRANFLIVRRSVLVCLYGGYIMYILLPAAGPHFDVRQLGLTSTGVMHAYAFAMQNLRYQFDCFPSLHTALPWTLVVISWVCLPSIMRAGLVICATGSTAATLGLGFHYGIDVIGGLLWCFAVVMLTHLSKRKRLLSPRSLGHVAAQSALPSIEKSDI